MNSDKIKSFLNIDGPSFSDEVASERSLVKANESSVSVYSKNEDVIKEVVEYLKNRGESVEVLIDARKKIKDLLNDPAYIGDVTTGKDWKDIDALSKLLNTLTNVVKTIDDLSNPHKVEGFIDPDEAGEPGKEGSIVNNQFNFIGTPADLVKLITGMKEIKHQEVPIVQKDQDEKRISS